MLSQTVSPKSQDRSPDVPVIWHVDLEIEGMTCAQCPPFVEKWLRGYPGVRSVTVDPRSAIASIVYDPREAGLKNLINIVRVSGRTAGEATLRIPVRNLHSPAGATRLEAELGAVPGVLSAKTNRAAATIDVKCNPAKVDSGELIRRIARTDLPEAVRGTVP